MIKKIILFCLFLGILIIYLKFEKKPKSKNVDNILIRSHYSPNDYFVKISNFGFIQSLSLVYLGNYFHKRCIKFNEFNMNLPWVFGITPTYSRMTQTPDLIRLGQSLEHVENFLWILVEDSNEKTKTVERILKNLCLNYIHLNISTPVEFKKSKRKGFRPHRGVEQRNLGLKWLRENIPYVRGVVYFMDDDNTYSVNLFDKIRSITTVSFWPVGLAGGCRWSGPLCENNGSFTKFHTNWGKNREYPVDMAGFGANINYVKSKPQVYFRQDAKYGYLEDQFLVELLNGLDVNVPKDLCHHVYVWHTRTENPKTAINGELFLRSKNIDSHNEVTDL